MSSARPPGAELSTTPAPPPWRGSSLFSRPADRFGAFGGLFRPGPSGASPEPLRGFARSVPRALLISFVTGVGAKTPMFPHHRPSAADTIVAPVPGLLVGGPNPGQQDHCPGYPSSLPALSYVDAQCSYASNEIAINWNAPIAYLSAAIDAEYRTLAR